MSLVMTVYWFACLFLWASKRLGKTTETNHRLNLNPVRFSKTVFCTGNSCCHLSHIFISSQFLSYLIFTASLPIAVFMSLLNQLVIIT